MRQEKLPHLVLVMMKERSVDTILIKVERGNVGTRMMIGKLDDVLFFFSFVLMFLGKLEQRSRLTHFSSQT